ncbi:MAG TPA: hypothetical protein VGJ20_24090 [Xanthobacteraceae bacterium]
MTDYQPIIARAVEGLGKCTGEARRSLYERARGALLAQLRAVEPALSETEITKERLALEEAIRKVEAEAARKLRTEQRPQPRFAPRPLMPLKPAGGDAKATAPDLGVSLQPERPDAAAADAPPPGQSDTQRAEPPPPPPPPEPPQQPAQPLPPAGRDRLLNAQTTLPADDGVKGRSDGVAEENDLGTAAGKAAASARDRRNAYSPPPMQRSRRSEGSAPPPPAPGPLADDVDAPSRHHNDGTHFRTRESSDDREDMQPRSSPTGRRSRPPRSAAAVDRDYQPQPLPRSYRGLARLALFVIILAGVAATVTWQRSNIASLYQFFSHSAARAPTETTQAPAPEPKFSGRVPQEQAAGQAAETAAPNAQSAPATAQRVVLYEEDPNDPQGKRYVGSATWRTVTVSPGPGLAPELAVRADMTIPDRKMTVTWSLRRNTDKTLPASHTIEIMFTLPPDFPGGGIANVPGILMKQAEQARGTPLAGLAVKVTSGFFLIGLSAVDADVQRNTQLLKDQEWFDIPLVYTNGSRAIIAVEKGAAGDRAFAEAFAAWQK